MTLKNNEFFSKKVWPVFDFLCILEIIFADWGTEATRFWSCRAKLPSTSMFQHNKNIARCSSLVFFIKNSIFPTFYIKKRENFLLGTFAKRADFRISVLKKDDRKKSACIFWIDALGQIPVFLHLSLQNKKRDSLGMHLWSFLFESKNTGSEKSLQNHNCPLSRLLKK